MTEASGVRVTPRATGGEPRLTENVTILLEPLTRAFILGTRAVEAARSEGAVARALIESAIDFYREQHPEEFKARAERGAEILRRRAE